MFLTGTGFGGVALAIMSLCRPGDEILVSDNVYGPTKEISEKLREHGRNSDVSNSIRFGTELIKYQLKTLNIFEAPLPIKVFTENLKE